MWESAIALGIAGWLFGQSAPGSVRDCRQVVDQAWAGLKRIEFRVEGFSQWIASVPEPKSSVFSRKFSEHFYYERPGKLRVEIVERDRTGQTERSVLLGSGSQVQVLDDHSPVAARLELEKSRSAYPATVAYRSGALQLFVLPWLELDADWEKARLVRWESDTVALIDFRCIFRRFWLDFSHSANAIKWESYSYSDRQYTRELLRVRFETERFMQISDGKGGQWWLPEQVQLTSFAFKDERTWALTFGKLGLRPNLVGSL